MARLTEVVCVLAIIITTAASASAQMTQLGEHGARVELGQGWKRQTLDRSLGDNQFIAKREGGLFSRAAQAFVVVMEMETLLENRDDFEHGFDLLSQVGLDSKIEIHREKQYTRASRRFDAEVSGLDFAYRLELLSKDGLAYYVLGWTLQSQREFLDEKITEFLGKFQFPGSDSNWNRQSKPVEQAVSFEGYDLSFSIRPFVLRQRPQDDVDQIVHLMSPDEEHILIAYEMEDYSTDELLEAAFEACAEASDNLVELSRRDLQVSDISGRMMVAKDDTHSFYLLALPIDGGRVLDIRYVSYGPPDCAREDRDRFLKTLKLTRSPSVIWLPEPVVTAVATPVTENTRTVFDRSKMLGDTTLGYARGAQRIAANQWLAWGRGSAVIMAPTQPAESLLKLEDWGISSMTRWGGRWYFANEEEEVRRVRDGTVLSTEAFAARCLAELGNDLLLVRSAESHALLGISSFGQMGTDVLLRRTRGGAERKITELPHVKVSMVVPNATHTSALLLAENRPAPWTEASDEGSTCLEVDLRSGSVREFGEWQSVEMIASTERGWLVTGRPRGLPRGIYRVGAAGEMSALITGQRIVGVELDEARLIFASDLLATAPEQPYLLYEVATSQIDELGPRCLAFSTQHINQIGRRLIDSTTSSGSPRTEAELRQALDEANRLAQDLVGAELPISGIAIDALVNEVYTTKDDLEPAGRALLAILVTISNLEQGAVWVEGGSGDWMDWLARTTDVQSTAFAVAQTPANLLTSVLDDGEGGWNPGTSVVELARGRTLLFGLDPKTLGPRVDASAPEGVAAALNSGRSRNIRAILDASPGNAFFRQQVWEHLVVRGQNSIVEELAQRFASLPFAEVADLRAWLAAWNHRVDDPAEAERLARAVLEAVRAHPTDANLCFLLGSAYEKAKPEDPAYARTCYQRVLRMEVWGPIGEAAKKALERLR